MEKFKEVTKNEFYQFIDEHTKEDLVLFSIGEYPYTTHWKTRWGNKLKAKSVNFHPKEKAYPVQTKYYILTL